MTKTKSKPAAKPERRLIDVREVAHMAGGVHTSTIPRWAADDILPKPIKLGHLVRWWLDEIEAALAKMPRTDQPSAEPHLLAERRDKARARAKAKALPPAGRATPKSDPKPAAIEARQARPVIKAPRKWRRGGPGRPPKDAAETMKPPAGETVKPHHVKPKAQTQTAAGAARGRVRMQKIFGGDALVEVREPQTP